MVFFWGGGGYEHVYFIIGKLGYGNYDMFKFSFNILLDVFFN
jgi:hypothetical protein